MLDVIAYRFLWKTLRNLRNNLAHDYPYDEQLIADTLNQLFRTANTSKHN